MSDQAEIYDELAAALRELEATMRATDLWRMEEPESRAFNSQQPFCIDTMTLPQWLRYIFIARLQILVDNRAPLPARCDVAPAVDAWLIQEGARAQDRALMKKVVEDIDRLVTRN